MTPALKAKKVKIRLGPPWWERALVRLKLRRPSHYHAIRMFGTISTVDAEGGHQVTVVSDGLDAWKIKDGGDD